MSSAQPIRRIRWRPLPKQEAFLFASGREVLYSGAFGAGKTRAVCMKAVMRASRPGAIEGLCRKHLVSLKATTLRTLLEPEGDQPPVLPEGSYEHHMATRRIKILGGGEIVYFGFGEGDDDSRTKIGSLTLSGCGIDQAEELTDREWVMLRGRIRLKVPGMSGQLYAACNPASPSHHLAVRFGLDGQHERPPQCEVITTRSADNTYLPQEYLADLATFTGVSRARYVEGLWQGAEGLVYDRWDRRVHVRRRPKFRRARCLVGQDEGYTNPAAMVLVLQDADGYVHVADEWYERRQLESAVVDQAQRWRRQHRPDFWVIDPSAAKLREAMIAASLPVRDANHDVFGGIQAVQKRLVEDVAGRPLLTVEPHCVNVVREFESYEWMPDKDKPRKCNDHAMDALRYAIMSLDGAPDLEVRVFAGGEEPYDDESQWQTWRS